MNPDAASFLIIAIGVLGAMVAVGAVLLIKISRRRHASRAPRQPTLDTGVPGNPMSRQHAERLQRHYVQAFAVVLTGLAALAAWLLT